MIELILGAGLLSAVKPMIGKLIKFLIGIFFIGFIVSVLYAVVMDQSVDYMVGKYMAVVKTVGGYLWVYGRKGLSMFVVYVKGFLKRI